MVTNPGDDVRLLGGEVWPDFDAVMYALAGLFDEERGWGIRGEGFTAADAASAAGVTGAWFRVGDRDLGLCCERAGWLDAGAGRAEVAARLRERLGVEALVVPATAERCETQVLVEAPGVAGAAAGAEALPLQEWLVREHAARRPLGIRVVPAAPRAAAEAVAAIRNADLVLLGPSSPVMSLLPLLAAPEIAGAVAAARRVVALSPTVAALPPRTQAEAGRYRVRGLLLAARGVEHTAAGVARLWGEAIDGFVLDRCDVGAVDAGCSDGTGAAAPGGGARSTVPTLAADLLAATAPERARLAEAVVAFGLGLSARAATAPVRVLPGL